MADFASGVYGSSLRAFCYVLFVLSVLNDMKFHLNKIIIKIIKKEFNKNKKNKKNKNTKKTTTTKETPTQTKADT